MGPSTLMKVFDRLMRAQSSTHNIFRQISLKLKKPGLQRRFQSTGQEVSKKGPIPTKSSDINWKDPGAIFLLVIPISTFGLGTWQVFRWQWKLGKIAELGNKVYAEPVELPDDLLSLDELEFRRVKVRGKFDYSREALVGPRSLYKDGPNTPKDGIVKKIRNDSGYFLITPFKVSGRDLTILVNRGWIPNRRDTNHRPIPEDKEVEITAVVRKTEPRPIFLTGKSFSGNYYLYRDIPKIAANLGTDTVFLDLNSVADVNLSTTFPIPGQTRVTLRNEHVSYFITWYCLSAITGYMWHRRFILKKPLV